MPANAKLTYNPTWTTTRAGLAFNRAQLCPDKACSTRLAETELAAGATTAALSATLGSTALADNAYKLLRLTGRTLDGLVRDAAQLLRRAFAHSGNRGKGLPRHDDIE